MSKQIDQLMALAQHWVQARTKGQGGSSQQDALRQALEAALNNWKQRSMTEIAAENHSAMEYCKHWEDRALKAEAALKPGEDDEPYECHVCGELDPCTSCGDPHCGLIAPPAQTPPKQVPRTGVWGYIDAQVARDMQGFYKAFVTATPPTQTPNGLFVDLIAQHPGLAEELKAIDDASMPTFPPPRLTENVDAICAALAAKALARDADQVAPKQFGVTE